MVWVAFQIPQYPEYYITRQGRLFDGNGEITTYMRGGYLWVRLGPSRKRESVHRLVAFTFLTRPEGAQNVDHLDENRSTPHADNLEWVTHKENIARAVKGGKLIGHPRAVQQFQGDTMVCEYKTVTRAAEAVGLSRSAISKACLGINPTAGNFRWKYANTSHNHEKIDPSALGAHLIEPYKNYWLFEDGRVYNDKRLAFLKPCHTWDGLRYVTLCSHRVKKNHYISALLREYYPDNEKLSDNEGTDTNSGTKATEGSS